MVERTASAVYNTIAENSRRWEHLVHRPGDVVVCTPPKSGTTWAQGIVRSLIWGSTEPPGALLEEAPWVDARFDPIEEVTARLDDQAHRRCMKTHTPADGIPLREDVHYVVVYRSGLDSFMSWVDHLTGMKREAKRSIAKAALADGVDLSSAPPPTDDPHEIYAQWIADPPQLAHFDTWWPLRSEPNVTILHYSDLTTDLDGEMRRLASILDIHIADREWSRVVERCTLHHMRESQRGTERLTWEFEEGADRFFNKGGGGRWRGVLTDDEVRGWHQELERRLEPAAAEWFERGSLAVDARPENVDDSAAPPT